MGLRQGLQPGDSDVSPIFCRLTESSISDIVAIEAQSNRPPWTGKLFSNEFGQPHSVVYGARRNGELVAFAVIHYIIDELHVMNLGVAPEARRLGVARGLLRYIFAEGFARGSKVASLELRRSNDAARRLYEQLGFYAVGERPGYYPDDGEDAVLMDLDLEAACNATKEG